MGLPGYEGNTDSPVTITPEAIRLATRLITRQCTDHGELLAMLGLDQQEPA